jgi:hypothetical protein
MHFSAKHVHTATTPDGQTCHPRREEAEGKGPRKGGGEIAKRRSDGDSRVEYNEGRTVGEDTEGGEGRTVRRERGEESIRFRRVQDLPRYTQGYIYPGDQTRVGLMLGNTRRLREQVHIGHGFRVFRVGCVGVLADRNAVGAGVVRLGEDAEDDGAPGTTPDGQT